MVVQKTPLQLSSQGKLTVTVGTAPGQSQPPGVTVLMARQAGTGQVAHSSPVTVTVGQPVWVGGGCDGPTVTVVRVGSSGLLEWWWSPPPGRATAVPVLDDAG